MTQYASVGARVGVAFLCVLAAGCASNSAATSMHFSDPLIVKYADGSETRVRMTVHGHESRRDVIALVIDDEVVDHQLAAGGQIQASFEYDDDGHLLQLRCTANRRAGLRLYDHQCVVFGDGKELGTMHARHRAEREPRM